jgi:undecaprenyl-diphosphatase
VAATRVSFFLAIPALVAAGAYEGISQAGAVSSAVGWGPTILATVVSFAVAYASIAWLLRLVSRHSIAVFIWYRVALGVVLAVLLATGFVAAT